MRAMSSLDARFHCLSSWLNEHGSENDYSGTVCLLIMDYLQMMRMKGRWDNRQQEITAISRSLKELAKELEIPVVALSQLHRGPETRGKGDHKPMLSDLRESGAIEQDADVVMFIYRPDAEVTTPQIPTKLLIAKHRNGPTGSGTRLLGEYLDLKTS
jgi:replicative DNA helicase